MSHTGNLFVITAPSGAGKTSLVKALVEQINDLTASISHTTRPRRPAEIEGIAYHFIDTPEFEAMASDNDFLEHALVYGNHYGTSKKWVEDQLAHGQDVVLEIDWQGAVSIQELVPSGITVFILPPSIQALADRLGTRQQDTEQVIQDRLASAEADISRYVHFDYMVVNADFQSALNELRAIVTSERLRRPRAEKKNAKLLAGLLKID